MKSTLYTVNWRDFFKGLIVAIGTPIVPIIIQSLNNNELTFNWKLILTISLGAFVTYLSKQFLTDDVKVAQKTLVKATEDEIKKAG